ADKHDLLTAPAGSIARAQQDAVTQFLICEMDAQLWTAAKHSFVLPPEQRLPEIKKTVAWEFAQTMRQLAEILGDKPFLMGEALTIPDIIAGQCGAWAQMAKLDLGSERVVDYIARLTARPAYQAASGA
ncbi:MAG: glutathione S-transferase family protein, partial [Mangrovicoccus sp.]